MKFMKYPFCFAILLSACTSFAQMYTITDLQIGNQFGDSFPRWGYGDKMNNLGQVVGEAGGQPNCFDGAFRTAPNSPVNPATDFLDCNNSARSRAHDINDSGQGGGDEGRVTPLRGSAWPVILGVLAGKSQVRDWSVP